MTQGKMKRECRRPKVQVINLPELVSTLAQDELCLSARLHSDALSLAIDGLAAKCEHFEPEPEDFAALAELAGEVRVRAREVHRRQALADRAG